MITKFKGRFRIVRLELRSLYPLLVHGSKYETAVGLLPGANLYYKYYDKREQTIYLMYSHPEFDVIEIGDQIPVQEIYVRTLDDSWKPLT